MKTYFQSRKKKFSLKTVVSVISPFSFDCLLVDSFLVNSNDPIVILQCAAHLKVKQKGHVTLGFYIYIVHSSLAQLLHSCLVPWVVVTSKSPFFSSFPLFVPTPREGALQAQWAAVPTLHPVSSFGQHLKRPQKDNHLLIPSMISKV